MLNQEPANERTGDGTNSPRNLVDAHVDGPLAEGNNVGYDDQAQGHQPPTSDTLNRAPGEQLIEVLREAAEQRADGEEAERDEVQQAATEAVGEGDEEGLEDGLGEEVSCSGPEGVGCVAMEVGGDGLGVSDS